MLIHQSNKLAILGHMIRISSKPRPGPYRRINAMSGNHGAQHLKEQQALALLRQAVKDGASGKMTVAALTAGMAFGVILPRDEAFSSRKRWL